MKKFLYFLGAFVLADVALLGINTYRGASKPVTVVAEQSAVSAPVSAEQKTNKTYRVAFRVSPVVQSSAKPQ